MSRYFCRRNVVQCRVLQSSTTCLVYFLSFFFPLVDVFRSNKHCIFVFQIITWSSLSFFIFHKLIQIVFPHLGWSSCFFLSSSRGDWALGGDRKGLSPFQSLCFDTVCDAVCHHFSLVSQARFSLCTQNPVFQFIFLARCALCTILE